MLVELICKLKNLVIQQINCPVITVLCNAGTVKRFESRSQKVHGRCPFGGLVVVMRRLLFSRELVLESQNSSNSYSKNERGGKILLVCLRNTPVAQCANCYCLFSLLASLLTELWYPLYPLCICVFFLSQDLTSQ